MTTRAIHPPLTLSTAAREAFDGWPADAQAQFEAIAAELEFVRRVSFSEAEERAFEIVAVKQAARGRGEVRR